MDEGEGNAEAVERLTTSSSSTNMVGEGALYTLVYEAGISAVAGDGDSSTSKIVSGTVPRVIHSPSSNSSEYNSTEPINQIESS